MHSLFPSFSMLYTKKRGYFFSACNIKKLEGPVDKARECILLCVLLVEWPPAVVDASKSGSEFQKQLDDAALKVKTSYW